MRRVFKFPIDDGKGMGPPRMPKGAEILSVGLTAGRPCVWALVDPDAPLVDRGVCFYVTGAEIPEGWEFVGTFIVDDALGDNQPFVGHVFDAGERE